MKRETEMTRCGWGSCVVILGMIGGVAIATEPRHVEMSADGHRVVEMHDDATGAGGSPEGGPGFNGVPYGATPSWSNALRRQVGAVAVGDVNNDGKNDVVVGCYTSQSFPPYNEWENLIYYNDGGSLEAAPSWVSADERHTGDILIADINMDTYPDIFSANGGTAFAPSVIYYGGPTGPDTTPDWIAAPPQATWCTAATAFDFDHDGDLDIFTANQGISPNPYRPMLGFRNNNGVLETTAFWQSAESSIQGGVAFGDLDGDGWEDLAVSKWVNFQTAIYQNVMGVVQTTPVWQTGSTAGDRGVAWADVDGDNDPDLAVGMDPTGLWTNNGGVLTHTWTSAPVFVTEPQDMKFFDVDRDGDPDLADIQFATGRVNIYINTNGVLSSAPSWSYDDPAVGSAIAFGDINGDEWPDLVIGLSGEPCVRVFYAVVPDVLGDMNCDGLLNMDDVDPFALALIDPLGYMAEYQKCDIQNGDMNGDTSVDGGDVGGFTAALTKP